MDLVSLVVALHHALDAAEIPHAFGGALALGYAGNPRGTVDVDINVFVTPEEMPRVGRAVAAMGYIDKSSPTDPPIAGRRFLHKIDPFPVDFFPSLDPGYDEIARRVVRHEFGPDHTPLPFLSAEDLCVFKLSFGRPQDWVDLAVIARAQPTLDVEYVERKLVGLRGATMYPRVARLRGLFRL